MLKRKLLLILHLPAPIHGAAMVGQFIKESKLINTSFEADYINLSTSNSLNQIGKKGGGKLYNLLKIQLKVMKALFNKQYDLAYITLTATGIGFYKDLLVIILLKLFQVKIVYHFHNKGVSANQNEWIDDFMYRFVFSKTQSILLSRRLYPDIEKYVKEEDVFFCANGIPKSVEVTSDNIVSNDSGPCQVLYLSNMMASKGVFILLQACSILREKGLKFECHFVGDWSDIREEEFNSYVQTNNLAHHVFAHGKKYGKDKYLFFRNSDVFVLPTYNETFGLVNLEAMEFGIPIISTPEGGIPDVVVEGETGFLVPQKNAVALAEKLEVLIKDSNLRLQMGLAGRRRFEEFFTLETFEKNFVNVINEVLKKKETVLETSDASRLQGHSTSSLVQH